MKPPAQHFVVEIRRSRRIAPGRHPVPVAEKFPEPDPKRTMHLHAARRSDEHFRQSEWQN
ncbi:hypothetical protein [Labrys monachus]|uniref:Uncharacterized protein n=1 Tax=Labrys monachus TaxID=217067 RepID=A0ABU0F915_9HYPH|nr:hypothetical protein [Labrys monachus]MDQ0391084.1 hypothetical protein [Labrys monachus]